MFREARDSAPPPRPRAADARCLAVRRRHRLRGRPGRRRLRRRGVHQPPAGADPAVRAPGARTGRPAGADAAPPPRQGPSATAGAHAQQHAHADPHSDTDPDAHAVADPSSTPSPSSTPVHSHSPTPTPTPTPAPTPRDADAHPDPHPDPDPDAHPDPDPDPDPVAAGAPRRARDLRLDPQGRARVSRSPSAAWSPRTDGAPVRRARVTLQPCPPAAGPRRARPHRRVRRGVARAAAGDGHAPAYACAPRTASTPPVGGSRCTRSCTVTSARGRSTRAAWSSPCGRRRPARRPDPAPDQGGRGRGRHPRRQHDLVHVTRPRRGPATPPCSPAPPRTGRTAPSITVIVKNPGGP